MVLYFFGRGIWYPFFLKIKGKESIESVNKKNEKNILKNLQSLLKNKKLSLPFDKITLIALKDERVLELWVKNNQKFIYFKSYPFTAFSGELGVKLKEGDKQIPEGIYKVEYLNPNSSYHLSIKINYPNEFDRVKAKEENRKNLGGDIFIHGKSSTVGCIPIGDKAIEELFYIVSKTNKKNIKVIISPYDMRIKKINLKNSTINWYDNLLKNIKTQISFF